ISSPRSPVTTEEQAGEQAEVIQLPVTSSTTEIALDELELVYAFIYARVGNRADAEDLTQLVALKAIPRLRPGSPPNAVRGYLFATADRCWGASGALASACRRLSSGTTWRWRCHPGRRPRRG